VRRGRSIYRFSFDENGPSHARIATHTCVPSALAWGESVVAAGADGKVRKPIPETLNPKLGYERDGADGKVRRRVRSDPSLQAASTRRFKTRRDSGCSRDWVMQRVSAASRSPWAGARPPPDCSWRAAGWMAAGRGVPSACAPQRCV
jgi:hypothetical protein